MATEGFGYTNLVFDTDDASSAERFAFWREAVCDSYVQLDCTTETPERFAGTIDLQRFSQVSVSSVGGSNQTVTRRQRDIARSGDESFLFSLQVKEQGEVAQDGRAALLRPGDMALYSSIERYQLRLPDAFQQLVVQIPRAELLSRLPDAEKLTAVAIEREKPFAALLASMLPQLTQAMRAEGAGVHASAQSALIDLIVSALGNLAPTSFELSAPNELTLMRADRFILEHLADPTLDRTRVAQAVGLSVRRLNELYALKGVSTAERIRSLRLDVIARDLRDPRKASLSASEIAFARGISNVQSFSRAFKAQHGRSPSAHRLKGAGQR